MRERPGYGTVCTMNTEHQSIQDPTITGVSRRTLLRSAAGAGAGLVAGGLATTALPAVASAASNLRTRKQRQLIALFSKAAADLLTPGATLVVRSPDLRIATTFGSGVLQGPRRLTLDRHFRVGSVTKTMTATVILQLCQRGDISLDDPVSRFRSDVPNGDQITIENLLTMHSGLYSYTSDLWLNQQQDAHPRRSFRPQRLLEIAFKARPHPVPGQEFEYCNTNTVLLGLIAQQVDGRPLGRQLHERLWQRVGMHDTIYPGPTFAGLPDPHPRGYMYGTNVSTIDTERLPPRQLERARNGLLFPNDVTIANPSWAGAAGAVISTSDDIARWVRALCDGSLLNRRWQRRRLDSVRPVNPQDPSAKYGLGIAQFGPMFGHTGEIPGFQTFAAYDPKRQLTMVIWCNLKASPEGAPTATTIARDLIGPLYG